MYYHVIIETNEKIGKNNKNREHYEFDKEDLHEIQDRIVQPFLREENFQFDGYFLKPIEIKRIAIRQSNESSAKLVENAYRRLPSNVFMVISQANAISSDTYTTNITNEVFEKAKEATNQEDSFFSKTDVELDESKVFIVHGRDDLARTLAARLVEKLGLRPIILNEQANGGQTIIEKIEANSDVGFALVLYTPCDIGGLSGTKQKNSRARQNVVFEHGFLIGKLGRERVCALVKGEVETPNDISGIVYVSMDDNNAWQFAVAKELKNAGYSVDLNRL